MSDFDPHAPTFLSPPRPPTSRGSRSPMSIPSGVIVGAIAVLLILGGVSIFAFLRGSGGLPIGATPTPQAQLNTTATVWAHATSTAIAQANVPATATATALQNIYTQATSGTPALSDPLSQQDSHNWDESANCAFVGGTYHASSSLTDNFFTCTLNAQASNFGDLAFQVHMAIIRGDYGGMYFRTNSTGTDYYTFTVDQSGQYSFDVYKGNNYLKTVSNSSGSAFKKGLNQSNLLTVVARSSNFYLYMNGQFVARWSDASYSAGGIGLLAGDNTHPTEVAFSDLRVWSI